MPMSAIRAVACVIALVLAASCGPPEAGEASEKAHAAWKLYRSKPDPGTYENFIRANRAAADRHGFPHDAAGIEYQLRALEVMAAESARANDERMADDVSERIAEIQNLDLVVVYDEVVTGAAARLAAARSLAESVIR